MSELEFATGTWIYGTVGDRYLLSGYREGLPVLERVKKIAGIKGITGIEMIYPPDFDSGLDEVVEAVKSAGLECSIVGVDLTGDPRWRYGSFSSRDPKVRRDAVELTKETVEVAVALGSRRINICPGEDGHDYPFQVDYSESWSLFRNCVSEVASCRPDIEVCLEYKLREPRARCLVDTAAKAVIMCRETGMENVGVTIDVGHSLRAGENISESIALLARTGRLFHVHLNDNYRGWDDDMALGSVHFVEFLEMMYTLRKVEYADWLSVDVYPYRGDPAALVAESIDFVNGLDALVDRIGMDTIDAALQNDDPIPLLSLVREATLG
ncbi:MAG: sugar phosphate isomerase/epimerase [Actinobacteria bacterium]|nr:sugar phosphate isomerase/epimerase [Actinomycetota bacterium]